MLSTNSLFFFSQFTAGGLATYIHADYMKSQLPDSVNYHAIADAGSVVEAEHTGIEE